MAINLKQFEVGVESPSRDATKKRQSDWSNILQKDIQLFGNGLGLKQKEALFSELSVLLSAGMDIRRSLELIEKNQTKEKGKKLISSIYENIVNGTSLSEAMRLSGKFSEYEIYSLQIGEESGQLVGVLGELSEYYTKSIKYRQQFLGALAYPTFVIGFAFLVVFFLLKYLVPMFSDVYKRFNGELPLVTRKLIDLSAWVEANGLYVILAVVAITVGLFFQKEKLWFKKVSASFLLRIPLFGTIISKVYLARFCQSMYLLLSAKVPLLRAVELVEKMIDFYPISSSLKVAKDDVLQGQLLHSTLSKSSFYPNNLIAMVQVGEEASQLDAMFKKLSGQYSTDVERQTAMIGSLIEPILIIGLGAIVGVILVAMYMPLFQMSVGVGG